ncbi:MULTISPECIES: cytochrome b [Tenebrionibacter/Tenebrionicola group]|uniref:Cytochrome b n=2 Tax=Tenebrionibacter/Tenebrionicola group TaxID=2969848 RepID=A0A8K0V6L4_9ENTR|nr:MULTISPECIES: cytochrome b [Tenebrionibacter/Tenebrionicola group]MBK4716353.1 cytochrome b [Tenebrionibacter intestinalis]MBV4412123.1 cytochrome b [Tenebrionicola larvae]MBV5097130.1 cytochrome b [Tenebrionicola larvae]
MQWRNSKDRYGHLAILLHWIIAITLYGMFGLGLWMVTLGYYDSWYHKAPELHKSIGILLLLAMIIRVVWRWISPPPPALSSWSHFTRISAAVAHILLYLLIFAIIFTGYLISTADGKPVSVFGWFEVPATFSDAGAQADLAGEIHLWLAWSIVLLSVAHALAALKHHFINKDGTLRRMMGKPSPDHGVK